ncbi:MAG: class II SORL domain-containing protein [Candidatus Thermoplasmatota archaeon]|nr:class II SORL domain-containing protein [Candidatus Thermoplasmatota archaeon]
MTKIEELYQTEDWKTEKHVPAIETKEVGEGIKVKATVGKEISHPNETEHHIRWIELYFKPEGEEYPIQLGKYEFTSHGESAKGPDTSGILAEPKVVATIKAEKPGTIIANSYCNIHGLWTNEKEL